MLDWVERIKNFIYLIPFGLKAADKEIMGSGENDSNPINIGQQVNDHRVSKHLLKGEVTQDVEELRYRTYRAERESHNYKYVGNGLAVKKDVKKEDLKKRNKIKFSQPNELICSDILTELNRIGGYGTESYRINIGYNGVVRFKFEQFLTLLDVLIDKDGEILTTMHFNELTDFYNAKSKPFVSSLEQLYQLFVNNDEYKLSLNDFNISMLCLDFVTVKATNNEPDGISYSFISPKLVNVEHKNGEYLITYKWDEYKMEDLTDKFYSKSLDEKYQKRVAKKIAQDFESLVGNDNEIVNRYNQKMKCSVCGRHIAIYDEGFYVDKKNGDIICKECYEKGLQDENE